MITSVLIDGEPSDGRLGVTDSSILRGDGCFEVLKAYGGVTFALEAHLDRLEVSARALHIELPPRLDLSSWIAKVATELVEGAVRVVVTRGHAIPGMVEEPRVIVFGHTWDDDEGTARLLPVVAPWHAAGVPWDLAGAKVLSYAPNLAASRLARSKGFDDAILVTVDDVILEGPTFSVAWVVDGVLETPGLDMGILDSITRRIVISEAIGCGIRVSEGSWPEHRLGLASEVMALSTIREVQPVVAVGGREWEPGPVTTRLAEVFATLTR